MKNLQSLQEQARREFDEKYAWLKGKDHINKDIDCKHEHFSKVCNTCGVDLIHQVREEISEQAISLIKSSLDNKE